MKQVLTIFAWIYLVQVVNAQNGATFPALTGNTLSDQSITIPQHTNGKFTIVGLTYSQKSEEILKKWFQPLYETFIADPEYEVNTYFVPMVSGIKEVAAGTIEKQMKKKVDPVLHPHILLYRGDIGEYKKSLGLHEKDKPYFFVLDKEGKVVYATSGDFTNGKLEAMEEIVDESWK
jgi:hypothetical protein